MCSSGCTHLLISQSTVRIRPLIVIMVPTNPISGPNPDFWFWQSENSPTTRERQYSRKNSNIHGATMDEPWEGNGKLPRTQHALPTTSPISQKSRSSTTRSQASAGIMTPPNKETTKGMIGLLAERMAAGGGALCNDQNGQCLGSRGNIDASKSGVYTAIAKLASQLDSTMDGSGSNLREVPLISIQTEKAVS